MKTKLLLLATILVSFLGGMIVGKVYFSTKEIVGKTTPEWAFLDARQLWRSKRKALKGDHDALMNVLRFYVFSMEDKRQAYFWARVGEKNGDRSGEITIREFNEKYKDSVRESVSLEQHFLDGGLGDDMIKWYEEKDSLESASGSENQK